MKTLSAIDDLNLLESEEVGHLRDAYLFLRRLENLLQAMGDKQTQTLPDNEQEQLKLAIAMQFADWGGLIDATRAHMANVHTVFEDLIGVDEEDANPIASHFSELWDMAHKPDVIEQVLEHDIAIASPPEAAKTIIQFKADLAKRRLVHADVKCSIV